ncbi:MAG: AhpC/TSA family protein, partial [Desulfobacterales bacterium]
QLYAKIESSPELKGRLKLIAIGAGNSVQQVAQFKKEYGLKFPVFADGNGSIHRQLGSVKFPYYMGVKLDGGHNVKIFMPGWVRSKTPTHSCNRFFELQKNHRGDVSVQERLFTRRPISDEKPKTAPGGSPSAPRRTPGRFSFRVHERISSQFWGVEAPGRQGAKTQEYLDAPSFRNTDRRDASAYKM